MAVAKITGIPKTIFDELVEKYRLSQPVQALTPSDPVVDRTRREWCRLATPHDSNVGEGGAVPILLLECSAWADGDETSALSVFPGYMRLTEEDLFTHQTCHALLRISVRHEVKPRVIGGSGNHCTAAFRFSRGLDLMGQNGLQDFVLDVLRRARELALLFPTSALLRSELVSV